MTEQESPEEIQSDIERLRDDMDSTIDAIEERLETMRPQQLMQRGKVVLSRKMRQAVDAGEVSGRAAMRELQRNPALGVVGVMSLALLITRLTGRH